MIDVPDSSDDDPDTDELSKKLRRYDNRMIQRLSDEVASIRDIIADMMSLTGLRRVLQDT